MWPLRFMLGQGQRERAEGLATAGHRPALFN
jgi:hypothetical protein